MPRPPFRRLSNGKRRRLPVKLVCRNIRGHALCSTQQAMLRNVQNNIENAMLCINLNFVNLLFAEALRRLFPAKEQIFRRIVDDCLHLHSHMASAL